MDLISEQKKKGEKNDESKENWEGFQGKISRKNRKSNKKIATTKKARKHRRLVGLWELIKSNQPPKSQENNQIASYWGGVLKPSSPPNPSKGGI